MADIFLSYSSKDRDRVRPVVEAFERRGWTVWWDREILPGGSFEELIDEDICRSQVCCGRLVRNCDQVSLG